MMLCFLITGAGGASTLSSMGAVFTDFGLLGIGREAPERVGGGTTAPDGAAESFAGFESEESRGGGLNPEGLEEFSSAICELTRFEKAFSQIPFDEQFSTLIPHYLLDRDSKRRTIKQLFTHNIVRSYTLI